MSRKLIRVSISRYDGSLRWVNGGNLFEEAVALEGKFWDAFRKDWKAGRYIMRAYGADLAEVTIPENLVRDGVKLKLDSSRDEIELPSGQVLRGIHVVIATPQGAVDPAAIGRKPGHELQKDRICRAALAYWTMTRTGRQKVTAEERNWQRWSTSISPTTRSTRLKK